MADGKFITEVILDRTGGFSEDEDTQLPERRFGKRAHLRYKMQRPDLDVTSDSLRSLPLTETDRKLVQYLGEVGYATTEQVSRLYYDKHKLPLKSAQKRLSQLWEWHLLNRVPCTGLEKYGLRPQLVYSLGKAGNLMLSDADAEGPKKRKQSGTVLMLHNLLLGELLIGLMTKGRKEAWSFHFYGERGAAVQFEYNDRRIRMRPDGLLDLNNEAEDIETPLFIEMDTSMRGIDHFRGKVLQYNSYFASNKWKARFELFPYVAVVVWGKSAQGDAKNRQRLADVRIQRIVAKVKGQKWTQGYNWLFARLDQAKLGHFNMLTAKAPELVKLNLFDVD